jgi:hypothetical protein
VIAGNYREFPGCCAGQHLSPRDRDLICVSSADRLQGRSDLQVERIGTWRQRRDLDEVEDMLRLVNRAPVAEPSPAPASLNPPFPAGQ